MQFLAVSIHSSCGYTCTNIQMHHTCKKNLIFSITFMRHSLWWIIQETLKFIYKTVTTPATLWMWDGLWLIFQPTLRSTTRKIVIVIIIKASTLPTVVHIQLEGAVLMSTQRSAFILLVYIHAPIYRRITHARWIWFLASCLLDAAGDKSYKGHLQNNTCYFVNVGWIVAHPSTHTEIHNKEDN